MSLELIYHLDCIFQFSRFFRFWYLINTQRNRNKFDRIRRFKFQNLNDSAYADIAFPEIIFCLIAEMMAENLFAPALADMNANGVRILAPTYFIAYRYSRSMNVLCNIYGKYGRKQTSNRKIGEVKILLPNLSVHRKGGTETNTGDFTSILSIHELIIQPISYELCSRFRLLNWIRDLLLSSPIVRFVWSTHAHTLTNTHYHLFTILMSQQRISRNTGIVLFYWNTKYQI